MFAYGDDNVLSSLLGNERKLFQEKQAAWAAKKTAEDAFSNLRKEVEIEKSRLTSKKGRLTSEKFKSRDKSRALYASGNKAAAAEQAKKTQSIRSQLDAIDRQIANVIDSRIEEIDIASKEMASTHEDFLQAMEAYEKLQKAVKARKCRLTELKNQVREQRALENQIFGNYKFGFRAWLRGQSAE
ncbi:MAG: hypothetical protein WCP11_03550 [Candidatus Saccharibacteria bacterium]